MPGGHIHRTWRVGQVVVQRLGAHVFSDLDALMANRQVITRALRQHLPEWADRTSLFTADGGVLATCGDGHRWRAHPHVAGVVPTGSTSLAVLRSAGAAFGSFLQAMAQVETPLHHTIANFHDPSLRLAALKRAAQQDATGRLDECRSQLGVAHDLGTLLVPLWDPEHLPVRVVHNDAKLANLVFSPDDHSVPAAVLDLDTTMDGTCLADVGELVRSSAAPAAEHRSAPVELDRVVAVVSGYLSTAGALLDTNERALLSWAGALLSFENGVRFLTDHLQGDPYFGASYPGQNLDRARAQLALAEDLVELQQAVSARLEGF